MTNRVSLSAQTLGIHFRTLVAIAVLAVGSVHTAIAQAPLDTLRSLTSDGGMYSNQIVSMTLTTPFAELCWPAGSVETDQHPAGGSTVGGNCNVGDIGWVIEQQQRPESIWDSARYDCQRNNMRLPEPFEFMISCRHATQLGLVDIVGDWEWASNSTFTEMKDGVVGIAAMSMGQDSCMSGAWNWVANKEGFGSSDPYRCVR